MKHVGNRDTNEPEIVAEFERLGFYVIRMPRDAGFDLLVMGEGMKIIVEVKNPETSWMWTKAEDELAKILNRKKIDYWTIEYKEEIPEVLGYERRNVEV